MASVPAVGPWDLGRTREVAVSMSIDAAVGVPDVFAPARLGPITVRNRTIKAATYENLARRGQVTDELIDFHVQHASGGVGMTTVAYCAVAPEGRTDRHHLSSRRRRSAHPLPFPPRQTVLS
jgi:hypothetical protein